VADQVAPPPLPADAPVPPQHSPNQPSVPTQPGVAAKAASAGKGVVKRVVGAVIGVAIVAGGGLAFKYLSGDPEVAKAGDCLVGETAEDLKIVKCDDPTAQWKVAGVVDGKTEAEFDTNLEEICAAYPSTQGGFWSGRKGGTGDVLCMEPVTK
jgi:hypothetical protein